MCFLGGVFVLLGFFFWFSRVSAKKKLGLFFALSQAKPGIPALAVSTRRQGARPRGARVPRRPPAGYWVRWRRPAERAQTRCAVHANAKKTYFTARVSAMTSRPTQRNTKGTYARPGTEPAPRGPSRRNNTVVTVVRQTAGDSRLTGLM